MDTSSTSQQLIVRPTSQVQVAPSHYAFEDYDDKERWASYWHQIRNTLRLSPRPRSILEIGGGTGLYRSYLANQGIEVRTADIDDTRKPDYLADVRDLDRTLPAGLRFDAVVAGAQSSGSLGRGCGAAHVYVLTGSSLVCHAHELFAKEHVTFS